MLIILLYKQQIINFIDHQLNGVTNSAGWIFMNYRNDKENFDKNTILYGHVRLNYIYFCIEYGYIAFIIIFYISKMWI